MIRGALLTAAALVVLGAAPAPAQTYLVEGEVAYVRIVGPVYTLQLHETTTRLAVQVFTQSRLHGFGPGWDGRQLEVCNDTPPGGPSLIVVSESGLALQPAFRVWGWRYWAELWLPPGACWTYRYDGAAQRWRQVTYG